MTLRIFILFILLFMCTLSGIGQSIHFDWVIQEGGKYMDESYGVATDNENNIYITGYFASDTAFFGVDTFYTHGGYDIIVAKYDSIGTLLWLRQVGGSGWDSGWNIALDNDNNVLITGKYVGDIVFETDSLPGDTAAFDAFIAKYDTYGNFLWVKPLHGPDTDMGHGIASDEDNFIYATGYFVDTLIFGADTIIPQGSNPNAYTVKLTPEGNTVWLKTILGFVQSTNIAVRNGKTCVVGGFRNTAFFGDTSFSASGNLDIFIAVYDTSGQFLWAKKGGSSGNDYGEDITIDSQGNIILIGEFSDNASFFGESLSSNGLFDVIISKLNSNGELMWTNTFGGSDYENGLKVCVDEQDNIYCTAGYYSPEIEIGDSVFGLGYLHDCVVFRMDASGNYEWIQRIHSSYWVKATSLAIDNSGQVVITGSFGEISYFGDTSLDNYGNWDIWLARIHQDIAVGLQFPENQNYENKAGDLLKIYPNPAGTSFTIEYAFNADNNGNAGNSGNAGNNSNSIGNTGNNTKWSYTVRLLETGDEHNTIPEQAIYSIGEHVAVKVVDHGSANGFPGQGNSDVKIMGHWGN